MPHQQGKFCYLVRKKPSAKVCRQSSFFCIQKPFSPIKRTYLVMLNYLYNFNPVQMIHCMRLVMQFKPTVLIAE